VAAAVVGSLLLPAGATARARDDAPDVSVVGVFAVGGSITGAAQDGDYLYIATHWSLSIWDTSNPALPTLLAAKPSPHVVYGELISTDGEILLLNDGLGSGTLDIWNVEDKTNPVLYASVGGVRDEHVSCLITCTWAYGSNGTVIDLRDPGDPDVQDLNWKRAVGIGRDRLHRVDEFRPGFMATAPREGPPAILDVRRPLQPRIVARTGVPDIPGVPNMFLYSEWTNGGRGRFMLSSTEVAGCDEEYHGALVTFDTKGWPADDEFEIADTYKYRGRTDSDDESCQAYYFALHPDFDDGGLALLPNGLEGTRILEIDGRGQIEEVDSFVLPTSDVWLAFWGDDEIFYALNQTGEVYVLRYSE
jgi:hypothetical protein